MEGVKKTRSLNFKPESGQVGKNLLRISVESICRNLVPTSLRNAMSGCYGDVARSSQVQTILEQQQEAIQLLTSSIQRDINSSVNYVKVMKRLPLLCSQNGLIELERL